MSLCASWAKMATISVAGSVHLASASACKGSGTWAASGVAAALRALAMPVRRPSRLVLVSLIAASLGRLCAYGHGAAAELLTATFAREMPHRAKRRAMWRAAATWGMSQSAVGRHLALYGFRAIVRSGSSCRRNGTLSRRSVTLAGQHLSQPTSVSAPCWREESANVPTFAVASGARLSRSGHIPFICRACGDYAAAHCARCDTG